MSVLLDLLVVGVALSNLLDLGGVLADLVDAKDEASATEAPYQDDTNDHQDSNQALASAVSDRDLEAIISQSQSVVFLFYGLVFENDDIWPIHGVLGIVSLSDLNSGGRSVVWIFNHCNITNTCTEDWGAEGLSTCIAGN